MQLILDRSQAVVAWASKRLPLPADGLKGAQAIGIAKDGKPIAAAIYHDFRILPFGKDIQLSFAADSAAWATRGNIRAVLSYPFVQLECGRLTAIISRKNKRGRKVLEGLGFHLEGVHRHAYDGKTDAISYAMYREDAARWLGDRPKKRVPLVSVADIATGVQ